MRKMVALFTWAMAIVGVAFGLAYLRDRNTQHAFVPRETALVLRIAVPRTLGLHMPCNLDNADQLTLWVVRTPRPSWLTQIRGIPEAAKTCARNALREGGHTSQTNAAGETFRRADGSAARIDGDTLWMGDGNALDRISEGGDGSPVLAACVSANTNGACIDARALHGPEGVVDARIVSLTEERIALRVGASGDAALHAAHTAFASVGVLEVRSIEDHAFTVRAPTESLRTLFTSGW